jgi:hypothetical protein
VKRRFTLRPGPLTAILAGVVLLIGVLGIWGLLANHPSEQPLSLQDQVALILESGAGRAVELHSFAEKEGGGHVAACGFYGTSPPLKLSDPPNPFAVLDGKLVAPSSAQPLVASCLKEVTVAVPTAPAIS